MLGKGRITLSGCPNNTVVQKEAVGCVRKRNRKSSTCVLSCCFLTNLMLKDGPELVIGKTQKGQKVQMSEKGCGA